MWDIRACRGCLAVNCKLEKLSNAAVRIYSTLTGLQITDFDGFPKYFCLECRMQIRKAMAFRRKTHRANFVLKEIQIVRKEVTFKDILTVNRDKTNLESSLGYWKSENNGFFCINDCETDDLTKETSDRNDHIERNLIRYKPKINNYSTYHVVNIIPDTIPVDNEKNEIEELKVNKEDHFMEEAPPPPNKEVELAAEEYDDTPSKSDDGAADDFDISNIDINDVFKDLKDNNVSDDDELDDIGEFKMKTKKRKKVTMEQQIESKSNLNPFIIRLTPAERNRCVEALSKATIEFQTLEQQSNNQSIRMLREPYQSSLFKCSMCLVVFQNKDLLIQHAILHNKWSLGKYVCKLCKNRFGDPKYLVCHLAMVHWYKYTCNNCGVSEYALRDFVRHYRKKHGPDSSEVNINYDDANKILYIDDLKNYFYLKPLPQEKMYKSIMNHTGSQSEFTCEICNIGYAKESRYLSHMKKHDESSLKGEKYQCSVCSLWFANLVTVEKHIANWHTYQYKCKICSAIVYNRTQASHHFKSHVPDEHKQKNENGCWDCVQCGKIFSTRKGLTTHTLLVHKTPSKSDAHCSICGKNFSTVSKLYAHQLQKHMYISLNHPLIGEEKFSCKTCDVFFTNEGAYHTHLVQMGHNEAKELPFVCLPCKKIFNSEDELSTHSVSCNRYPKKCKYCETVASCGLDYKMHYTREHPDLEYPHIAGSLCELCGKSIRVSMLKAHMENHYAPKTSQCNYCPTESPTATQLVIHILSVHTRTPYHCAICDKKYKNKAECRDHILKIHSPITPFICEYCGKTFSHIDFLNHHSLNVHGVEVKSTYKSKIPIKRVKGKLYLYPNMKIDVSLVHKEVLTQIELELCDYLDEKSKPIQDCDNYFVSNLIVDLDSYVKKKKMRRRLVGQGGVSKKKIKTEKIEKDLAKNYKMLGLNKTEKKGNIVEHNEIMNLKYEDSEVATHGGMDVVVKDTDNQQLIIDGDNYEIVEQNGERYIIIDDILYKLEEDEEPTQEKEDLKNIFET